MQGPSRPQSFGGPPMGGMHLGPRNREGGSRTRLFCTQLGAPTVGLAGGMIWSVLAFIPPPQFAYFLGNT